MTLQALSLVTGPPLGEVKLRMKSRVSNSALGVALYPGGEFCFVYVLEFRL